MHFQNHEKNIVSESSSGGCSSLLAHSGPSSRAALPAVLPSTRALKCAICAQTLPSRSSPLFASSEIPYRATPAQIYQSILHRPEKRTYWCCLQVLPARLPVLPVFWKQSVRIQPTSIPATISATEFQALACGRTI